MAMPWAAANRRADSSVREPTATTSQSGVRRISSTSVVEILPVARIPQRTGRSEGSGAGIGRLRLGCGTGLIAPP